MQKVLKNTGWILFAFLAIGVGLYPLTYLIVERTFGLLGNKSPELLANIVWNFSFYTHIILGGFALLIGWIQFSEKLRLKNIKLHRRIGKLYVLAALLSGLASLYIAYFATGGKITSAGFYVLGVIWLYTTYEGYVAAKTGRISKHQKMMIFSYAACFAAVTLRIWLPILITYFKGDFLRAYEIVAWLCWVPNIIVAYFIIRRLPA